MRGADVDYEEAKRLARDEDVAVRRGLAANPATRPEILYFLAADDALEVRSAIAANESTPRHADAVLARDAHAEVRAQLAQKIARLLPGLGRDVSATVKRLSLEIVDILARDQDARVRQALSEGVARLTSAPHHIVMLLARDVALSVAGPVLEHSPLLGEEDLLRIIAGHPVAGALAAIARRSRVAATVADAIAGTDDDAAIVALLANPSAQIREVTLDALLERAPDRPSWHGPLVRRPLLPAHAIRRLAGFVAGSLVAELRARVDLDPESASLLAARVHELAEPDWAAREFAGDETPAEHARRLHRDGRLDEAAVAEAVASGERGFVVAALAELAGMAVTAVEAVLRSQSARAVTSLAWKAGLSMDLAVQVQARIAHIEPGAQLHPREGTRYPLAPEDMEWQLEFFGS